MKIDLPNNTSTPDNLPPATILCHLDNSMGRIAKSIEELHRKLEMLLEHFNACMDAHSSTIREFYQGPDNIYVGILPNLKKGVLLLEEIKKTLDTQKPRGKVKI